MPVATLNRVEADDFSWLVPGLREELVTELIRSLPKNLRVGLVPAPDTAREFLASVPAGSEPLLDALERFARGTRGVVVPREAWDFSKVPAHLQPTFSVRGEDGRETARGKDLDALKAPLRGEFDAAIAEVAADSGVAATGETTWAFGTLETSFTQKRAGHEVRGYPALVDEGATVGVAVLASEEEAAATHRLGLRRLLLLGLGPVPKVESFGLDQRAQLGLVGTPYATVADLVDDVRAAVVADLVDDRAGGGARVRDEAAYADLLALAREGIAEGTRACLADVLRVLAAWREADRALSGRADLHTLPALTDMKAQVARLVEPADPADRAGFIGQAGARQLREYTRYFKAVVERRARLDGGVNRDRQLMDQVAGVQQAWQHAVAAVPRGQPWPARLRTVRWMLEEYRVSLWAQQLGTRGSVSDQRIRKTLG